MSDLRRRGGPQPIDQSRTTYSISPVPSYSNFDTTAAEIMTSNSGRDRTSEFTATIRSLKGRQLNQVNQVAVRKNGYNVQLAEQNRKFMEIAATIGTCTELSVFTNRNNN